MYMQPSGRYCLREETINPRGNLFLSQKTLQGADKVDWRGQNTKKTALSTTGGAPRAEGQQRGVSRDIPGSRWESPGNLRGVSRERPGTTGIPSLKVFDPWFGFGLHCLARPGLKHLPLKQNACKHLAKTISALR